MRRVSFIQTGGFYVTRVVSIAFSLVFVTACSSPPDSSGVESDPIIPQQITVEVTSEVTRLVEIEVTRLVEVTREIQVTPQETPTPVSTPTPEVRASAENYLVANFDLASLPPGEEGQLSIISTGVIDRFGNMPLIIRNNTGGPVGDLSVSSTVRSADGSLVGTGDADSLYPRYDIPGGIAIGEMRFDDNVSADHTFEYQIEGDIPASDDFSIILDLEIIEHNNTGNSLVGFVLNSNDEEATLVGVRYLCLNEDHSLVGIGFGSLAQDMIALGGQAAFSAELRMSCMNYILTSSGL